MVRARVIPSIAKASRRFLISKQLNTNCGDKGPACNLCCYKTGAVTAVAATCAIRATEPAPDRLSNLSVFSTAFSWRTAPNAAAGKQHINSARRLVHLVYVPHALVRVRADKSARRGDVVDSASFRCN